jgi:hypothetical protein
VSIIDKINGHSRHNAAWKKDRDSIMRHFDWCDFRDPVGHSLAMNIDFMDVIDELMVLRQKVEANDNLGRY